MLEPDVNIWANMPHVMLIRSRDRGKGRGDWAGWRGEDQVLRPRAGPPFNTTFWHGNARGLRIYI